MELIKPANNFNSIHAQLVVPMTGKAVLAAVRLKIFDLLEASPLTTGELADRLGTVVDRTEALLDLLVALGLLERDGGVYANSPAAREFLVSASPLYQGMTMELTSAFYRAVENNIPELLAGGSISEDAAAGDWSGDDAMDGTAQDARATALYEVVEAVAGLDGFDRFETMCDIGGNHGLFSMGVLDRNPAMTGAIFDQPGVVEQANARCRAAGYGDRIEAKVFDFRSDELPPQTFDLVLTSHVLYVVKNDLASAMARIADGLKPGGWFVSHHYSGRLTEEIGVQANSLELMTRLAGYPSHFVEGEELKDALTNAGFTQVSFQHLGPDRMGLITTARKAA